MNESRKRADIAACLTGPAGQFPLKNIEVHGVGLRTYADAPETLRDIFLVLQHRGSGNAVTFEDEHYTWDEYHTEVANFAHVLVRRFGVRKGDRVALAMRNYPEWLFSFAASVSVGALCVPLNAWWTASELQDALADCTPTIFIGDSPRVAAIQSFRASLPGLKYVVEVRPGDELVGDHDWQELRGDSEPLDLASTELDAEDDCTIVYTSGTTGAPKGAVATHRAHVANLYNMLAHGAIEAQMTQWRDEPIFPPISEPASLVLGPLFHIAGLPRIYWAALMGMRLVMMYKWNPERAIELIEREQVTHTGGVPHIVRQLLDAADEAGTTLLSLRSLSTGGSQSSTTLINRIRTQFCGRVGAGTGYGLTETTGPMVGIGSHDYFERPLAVGRGYPPSEIRVVDDAGASVAAGDVGEAWFKGPNLARQYWNRSSSEFMADGWFRSGDLVRQDGEGFFYIVGRIKDMVIRSGENVYCAEVEEVLSAHPSVLELAVFGVPHDLWGEEVACAVRPVAGAPLTADGLQEFARAKLATFKVPTAIWIESVDLPRNAAGKLLKRDLQAKYGKADT